MMSCSVFCGGEVMVNGMRVQKVLSYDEVEALRVSSGAQCGLLHVNA